MVTRMQVNVLAAALAATVLVAAQPVKAATAIVQPHSVISDLGSETQVVEVGRRGPAGYGGVYQRGGYGYRRGGYRGGGYASRGGYGYRGGYASRGGYGHRGGYAYRGGYG